MFEQAVLAVQDEKAFKEVHDALEAAFADQRVGKFALDCSQPSTRHA